MAVRNVWIDDAVPYSGDTLDFIIKRNGVRVYDGYCVAKDAPIVLYPNRIAQEFLESNFSPESGVTADPGASADFSVVRMSGDTEAETLYSVTYINGYAGEFSPVLSEPINGKMDYRGKIMFSSYNASATTITIETI